MNGPTLTLGTVQLGMAYGVANRTGRPHPGEARAILDLAVQGGVAALDTARAYGDSEAVIGAWLAGRPAPLPIVTKLAPLTGLGGSDRGEATRRSLEQSRAALGLAALPLVLAHREEDLLDTAVQDILRTEQERGRLGAVGVSATRPELLEAVLDSVAVAAVQIPCSVADQRYAGLAARARTSGATVYGRSAFLQGALLLQADTLPGHLAALRPGLELADGIANRLDWTRSRVMLAYVRGLVWIDSVVVGVETAAQLAAHLGSWADPPLPERERTALAHAFRHLPDDVVDPARWPRRAS